MPYCRHRQFLDIHHIVPRVAGETTDERGLLPLCPMHHHAIHKGVLALWVSEAGELTVLHGDGQRFGPGAGPAGPNDDAIDAAERVSAVVDARPGAMLREIALHAGMSHHRTLHLLNALLAAGDVIEGPRGEWFLVSQLTSVRAAA